MPQALLLLLLLLLCRPRRLHLRLQQLTQYQQLLMVVQVVG